MDEQLRRITLRAARLHSYWACSLVLLTLLHYWEKKIAEHQNKMIDLDIDDKLALVDMHVATFSTARQLRNAKA